MTITSGSKVTLEFTLSVDGEAVASADAKEPLEYTHGQNEILPGLETELEGLAAGDTKSVTLEPTQAYGAVDEALYRKVEVDVIPEEYRREGIVLQQQREGGTLQFRVKEVTEEHIVLDLNHPLAGKSLEFDLTVVTVE